MAVGAGISTPADQRILRGVAERLEEGAYLLRDLFRLEFQLVPLAAQRPLEQHGPALTGDSQQGHRWRSAAGR